MNSTTETEIESGLVESIESVLTYAIRQFPRLYDKNDKYSNASFYAEKHEEAWNTISDLTHLELNSCKTFWHCIKQKYIKYRKNRESGKYGMKDWPTFDELHPWLDQHIKKRRRYNLQKPINSIKNDSQTSANDDEFVELDEKNYTEPISTEEFVELNESDVTASSTPSHIPTLKRKQIHSSTVTPIELPKKILKLEVLNESDDNSETDIFTEIDHIESENEDQKDKSIEVYHIESETSLKDTTQQQQQEKSPITVELLLPTSSQTTSQVVKQPNTSVYSQKRSYSPKTVESNENNNETTIDEELEVSTIESTKAATTTTTTAPPATHIKLANPSSPKPSDNDNDNEINSQIRLDNTWKKNELFNVQEYLNDKNSSQIIMLQTLMQENFKSLDATISKCLNETQKIVIQQTAQQKDSIELFGNLIASLIREVPTEKRYKIRTQILQYASDLVAKTLQ